MQREHRQSAAVMREEQQDPFSGILSHEEKVDLVPSNLDLSALEMSLVTAMSRESVMKNYLSQVKDRYDYVLIDCMPSLGMITLNALTAADSVIIPVQAQYLPAKGMTQLLSTIAKVKKHTNRKLPVHPLEASAKVRCLCDRHHAECGRSASVPHGKNDAGKLRVHCYAQSGIHGQIGACEATEHLGHPALVYHQCGCRSRTDQGRLQSCPVCQQVPQEHEAL